MKSYYSETLKYTSKPQKGKPYGTRNIVSIKNGVGSKNTIKIDKNGKVLNKKTVKLSKKEANNILKGKFMPGFWNNCNIK
jgi:hypothetical protein